VFVCVCPFVHTVFMQCMLAHRDDSDIELASDLPDHDKYDWCFNTNYSQSCIALYVILYAIMSTVYSTLPKHVQRKHTVTVHQLAVMEVGWQQRAQGFLLCCTFVCAVFLLGNFGAEKLMTEAEKVNMVEIGSWGFTTLLITVVWRVATGWRGRNEPPEDDSLSDDTVDVVEELSWFYPIASFALSAANAVAWGSNAFIPKEGKNWWWLAFENGCKIFGECASDLSNASISH